MKPRAGTNSGIIYPFSCLLIPLKKSKSGRPRQEGGEKNVRSSDFPPKRTDFVALILSVWYLIAGGFMMFLADTYRPSGGSLSGVYYQRSQIQSTFQCIFTFIQLVVIVLLRHLTKFTTRTGVAGRQNSPHHTAAGTTALQCCWAHCALLRQ